MDRREFCRKVAGATLLTASGGLLLAERVPAAVVIDRAKCVGCGACVKICPVAAVTLVMGKAKVDGETCIECGTCIPECPVSAIRMPEAPGKRQRRRRRGR